MNVMCCLEQIPKATPHKTAAIWPLTSHLKKYPSKTNKTCKTLLEMFLYGPLHSDVPLWTPTQ